MDISSIHFLPTLFAIESYIYETDFILGLSKKYNGHPLLETFRMNMISDEAQGNDGRLAVEPLVLDHCCCRSEFRCHRHHHKPHHQNPPHHNRHPHPDTGSGSLLLPVRIAPFPVIVIIVIIVILNKSISLMTNIQAFQYRCVSIFLSSTENQMPCITIHLIR